MDLILLFCAETTASRNCTLNLSKNRDCMQNIFSLFLLYCKVSVFLLVIFLFVTHTFMHISAICKTVGLKFLISSNLLIYLVPPKCLISQLAHQGAADAEMHFLILNCFPFLVCLLLAPCMRSHMLGDTVTTVQLPLLMARIWKNSSILRITTC